MTLPPPPRRRSRPAQRAALVPINRRGGPHGADVDVRDGGGGKKTKKTGSTPSNARLNELCRSSHASPRTQPTHPRQPGSPCSNSVKEQHLAPPPSSPLARCPRRAYEA
ncbi:unnamed protein product [Lampetra planeri]